MRVFLLGAALLAFSACGSNSDPGPGPDPVDPTDEEDPPTPEESARDYDELASILGAHVRGEFEIQLAGAAITENRVPEGFVVNSSSVELSTGSGSVGGMSYTFEFYCNDGSPEHTRVACDGNAHHSHILYTATGSQSVGAMAMNSVNRRVDWEIRDITVDKARFRGPSEVSLQTQVTTQGVAATYKVSADAIYEQVRFLPGQQVPTFGTIDFMINTERMRGTDRRVFNANAQLVYGASGAPTQLTIDGTYRYTIDLASGAVVKL